MGSTASLGEEFLSPWILDFRSGAEFAAAPEERDAWIAPDHAALRATTELKAKVKTEKILNPVCGRPRRKFWLTGEWTKATFPF
jgi:hypothetical protein